jgi:hypothetical protein
MRYRVRGRALKTANDDRTVQTRIYFPIIVLRSKKMLLDLWLLEALFLIPKSACVGPTPVLQDHASCHCMNFAFTLCSE